MSGRAEVTMPTTSHRAALGTIAALGLAAAVGPSCHERPRETACERIKTICAAPSNAFTQETCMLLAEHPQAGTETACSDGLRRMALEPPGAGAAKPPAPSGRCHPSYEGACLLQG